MGSCSTKSATKKTPPQPTYPLVNTYSTVLTKQEKLLFEGQKSSELKFFVKVSNIKGRNIKIQQSKVIIIFGSEKHKIQTQLISNTHNPRVISSLEAIIMISFMFFCEVESSRTILVHLFSARIINFTVRINENSNNFATIKFNLSKIATGPIHNDFLLEPKEEEKGRISFDIRMAQIVNMKISCKTLDCLMEENLEEKAYNFNFKIKSHQLDYESEHSPSFMNPTYAFSQVQNIKREKQQSSDEIEENKEADENFNFIHTKESECKINQPRLLAIKKKQKDGAKRKDSICLMNILSNTSSLKGLRSSNSQKLIANTQSNKSIVGKSTFGNQQSFKKQNSIGEQNSQSSGQGASSGIFDKNSNSTFEQLLGHKETQWEFIDQLDQETPFVDFEILADEFSSSSFEFLLWAEQKPNEKGDGYFSSNNSDNLIKSQILKKQIFQQAGVQTLTSLNQNRDEKNEELLFYKQLGNCNVSMMRFISEDVAITMKHDQLIINESSLSEMKLWDKGMIIGQWKGQFIIQNELYIRQLVGGIRTEQGVTKQTQFYIQKQHLQEQSNSLPNELKKIINSKLIIDEYIINLNSKQMALREKYKMNETIKQQLTNINQQLLINTYQQSQLLQSQSQLPSFQQLPAQFANEDVLLASQSVLIELAKHVLEYADQVDENLRELYYQTLILINNREELDQGFIGFQNKDNSHLLEQALLVEDLHLIDDHCHAYNNKPDSHQVQPEQNQAEMKEKHNESILSRKIRLSLTYESYLNSILQQVLIKLDQKGLNVKERQFIENFCVIAFFKIDKFQQQILSCLDLKKCGSSVVVGQDIIESWIEEKISVEKQISVDTKYKYSQNNKYQHNNSNYLQNQSRHIQHQQHLDEILSKYKNTLSYQMNKRSITYLMFINQWCSYVINRSSNIQWTSVPGYKQIIYTFLSELKTKECKCYPEALKQASLNLLHHIDLINIYINIIYSKTNAYDSQSVYYGYDIINKWIMKIIELQYQLPVSFDYSFFFKGIQIILQGEHCVSIQKVLWMLYNTYSIYPIIYQVQLLEILLFNNLFFKLFMHWSSNVRQIFHHFLIYKVNHFHKDHNSYFNTNSTPNNKLEQLNKQLKLIRQNSKQIQDIEQRGILYNQQIYYDYNNLVIILEEGNKRLMAHNKKNELQMVMKSCAQTLKLKYIHKKLQNNKQQMKDNNINLVKQSQQNNQELDDNYYDSIDLSIISRQQSIHSLCSLEIIPQINEQEEEEKEDNKQYQQQLSQQESNMNEKDTNNNDLNNRDNEVNTISDIDSILSDIDHLEHLNHNNYHKNNNNNSHNNMDFQDKNGASKNIKKLRRNSAGITASSQRERRENTEEEEQKEERNGRNEIHNLKKILHHELKNKKSFEFSKCKLEFGKDNNKSRIRIYKRYQEQDIKQDKLKIPKELLKYLPISWTEFTHLQKQYDEWISNWYKEYANDDSNIIHKILHLNAPSLDVKVPRDESERQSTFNSPFFKEDSHE